MYEIFFCEFLRHYFVPGLRTLKPKKIKNLKTLKTKNLQTY